MKKIVQAKIDWTPVEDGGRKVIPPVGMHYGPMIVFESETPTDTIWSASIYNTSIDGRTTISDLSYLVDDAPYHLLTSGSKFRLFEHQYLVAEGVILSGTNNKWCPTLRRVITAVDCYETKQGISNVLTAIGIDDETAMLKICRHCEE